MGKLNLPYDKPSRLTFKEATQKTDKKINQLRDLKAIEF